ncbi:FMN-binding negative transcriptional regulator [Nocardioides sp. Kera G14]|uniref:FMN-binding negative transcriptional regulator n=1 Tax=Nocardioides sp. Kera G14 TaxID=2884264 RepID=UPI001D11DA3A|nr:FMN-binding negative transcriptional regulator [Nocardioides sp. Kera G14]UDY25310.1 FMN-binding negative transcriptional regulator [Nocardioides sp. Kera G14]
MYTPVFNRWEDEAALRAFVAEVGSAWFVTSGPDGVPQATLLPIIWRDEVVVAHIAKANPHWREIVDGSPALLIVGGPEAYISPSLYAAKAEHGKVVPTWNYTAVHIAGAVTVRPDAGWLRSVVTELTDRHEGNRTEPWQVADAPEDYIDGMLKAIVGLEIRVTSVEGKAKLSQNRPAADQAAAAAVMAVGRHP